ncbi:MAG: hypothetical protein Q9166_005253 [cf. Caloplaca sp. 2 TL-2023]
MNGAPDCKASKPIFSVPAIPSEPPRSRSPAKRTSVVGDSSSFLTALAAQERRVLELREEFHKAEEDLSRLKKQWATHEAIKKRNEFRQREQLQKLEPASHSLYEEDRERDYGRASLDSFNRTSAESERANQEAHANGEQKANRRSRARQTQRKVFAGSRQTRALSLLSKVGTTRNTPDQMWQEHRSQIPLSNNQTSTFPKRSQTLTMGSPHKDTIQQDLTDGQPKEIFIETGKQLVGDLREGLWTFFEDLRQATVGEEASSTPHRTSKAAVRADHTIKPQEGCRMDNRYILKSLPENGLDSGGASGVPLVTSTASK